MLLSPCQLRRWFWLGSGENSPSGRSKVCSILSMTIPPLHYIKDFVIRLVSKEFTVYQRTLDVPTQSNIFSIDKDCWASRICLFKGFSIFALLHTSSNTSEHVFSVILFRHSQLLQCSYFLNLLLNGFFLRNKARVSRTLVNLLASPGCMFPCNRCNFSELSFQWYFPNSAGRMLRH